MAKTLEDKLRELDMTTLQKAYVRGYALFEKVRTLSIDPGTSPSSGNKSALIRLFMYSNPLFNLPFNLREFTRELGWTAILAKGHQKEISPQQALLKGLNQFVGKENPQSLKYCILRAILNPDEDTESLSFWNRHEPEDLVAQAKGVLENLVHSEKEPLIKQAEQKPTHNADSYKP